MNRMETNPVPLDEFVRSAITQIMRAVSSSRSDVKKLGGELNPRPRGEDKDLAASGVTRARGRGSLSYIEFDVAVTATGGQSRESGIGVGVLAGLKAGIKQKSESNNQTVSRISFRLPVCFP